MIEIQIQIQLLTPNPPLRFSSKKLSADPIAG